MMQRNEIVGGSGRSKTMRKMNEKCNEKWSEDCWK